MDSQQFRAAAHQMIDYVIDYLDNIRERWIFQCAISIFRVGRSNVVELPREHHATKRGSESNKPSQGREFSMTLNIVGQLNDQFFKVIMFVHFSFVIVFLWLFFLFFLLEWTQQFI